MQEDFHGSFEKLLERYNKCIAAGGDYFEGNLSFMSVLSIKVLIRKKSGNLSYAPHIYVCVCICVFLCVSIYIFILYIHVIYIYIYTYYFTLAYIFYIYLMILVKKEKAKKNKAKRLQKGRDEDILQFVTDNINAYIIISIKGYQMI